MVKGKLTVNRDPKIRKSCVIILGFASCFMLLVTAIWAMRGDLIRVTFLGVVTVISTVQFSLSFLGLCIHNRFDKLEKRLDELGANKPRAEQKE